jgi:cation diffusion facilitator CzcD-associated flavoprotein CzcO
MICNGYYWDQVKPNIPGMEKFKGVIVHSGDYRTFHPYVGKRVVIVGCSHSAGMYIIRIDREREGVTFPYQFFKHFF